MPEGPRDAAQSRRGPPPLHPLQSPTQDCFLLARSELETRIAVLTGGRAAEALVFGGDVSTGAAAELGNRA